MGISWNFGVRTTALVLVGVFVYLFGLTYLPGEHGATLRILVTLTAIALPLLLYQALFRRTW